MKESQRTILIFSWEWLAPTGLVIPPAIPRCVIAVLEVRRRDCLRTFVDTLRSVDMDCIVVVGVIECLSVGGVDCLSDWGTN